MKRNIKNGDIREYRKIVQPEDVASFHGRVVHEVYATFALARDVEWTTRLFVLDEKEDDEEGVGTFLSIDHKGPAFVGEEISICGTVDQLVGNELICSFEAKAGGRIVAVGKTGQKILKREKINSLFKVPGKL